MNRGLIFLGNARDTGSAVTSGVSTNVAPLRFRCDLEFVRWAVVSAQKEQTLIVGRAGEAIVAGRGNVQNPGNARGKILVRDAVGDDIFKESNALRGWPVLRGNGQAKAVGGAIAVNLHIRTRDHVMTEVNATLLIAGPLPEDNAAR